MTCVLKVPLLGLWTENLTANTKIWTDDATEEAFCFVHTLGYLLLVSWDRCFYFSVEIR